MLHVGLDLSRTQVHVHVLDSEGVTVGEMVAHCDGGGLTDLAWRIGRFGDPDVRGVIESMNGARFVHDTLTDLGWQVRVADAVKVRGFAPVVAKTDRIDAWVLAELSRRDLVPAIWLPDAKIRAGREICRYRHHLIKQRTMTKNRIHSTLITFGIPRRVSDLFGVRGRSHLEGLSIPDPWRAHLQTSLEVIDQLDAHIGEVDRRIHHQTRTDSATQLLLTAPGIGPILGYTITTEIGDIGRFRTPKHLVGYTGLTPRVDQSGDNDWRGPLTRLGPRLLRWALIEATTHAQRHPAYRDRHQRLKHRRGKHRGATIARVDTARRLTHAIWWMLTKQEPFSPQGPSFPLVA